MSKLKSVMAVSLLSVMLLTTACDIQDWRARICEAATEGLPPQNNDYEKCQQDVYKETFHAAHQAAQKYRDMPR